MKLSAGRIYHKLHFILVASALCTGSIAQAATYSWTASSGLLPNSAGSPWRLETLNSGGTPTLTPDGLLISTTDINEMQYYVQDGANASATDALVIEASLKIVSEIPTIDARAAALIGFTTAPYTGTSIGIGNDEVFWLSSSPTRGGTAFVDTNDAFHTYRIEVTGNQPGNLFRVYQDSILILSAGVPYDNNSGSPIAGTEPQIYFGDGTSYSAGTAIWGSFSNNLSSVSNVPEPSSVALMLAGGLLISGVIRKRGH